MLGFECILESNSVLVSLKGVLNLDYFFPTAKSKIPTNVDAPPAVK
jgi:predicted secreted Zn-dependent protease